MHSCHLPAVAVPECRVSWSPAPWPQMLLGTPKGAHLLPVRLLAAPPRKVHEEQKVSSLHLLGP